MTERRLMYICPNCNQSDKGFRLFVSHHDIDSLGRTVGDEIGTYEVYMCLATDCNVVNEESALQKEVLDGTVR